MEYTVYTVQARQATAGKRIFDQLFIADHSAGLQLLGMTLMLALFGVWQCEGYGWISLCCFAAGTACLVWSALTAFRVDARVMRYRKNTVLLIVLEGLSLFYLFRNWAEIQAGIEAVQEIILAAGLIVILAVQLLYLALSGPWPRPDRAAVRRGLVLAALCLLFGFVLNLECFNTWVRWDAFHYYHSFELMHPQDIFTECSLEPCNHNASSYALWSLLFIAIPGINSLNALYLSNMALVALDLVLLYFLFRHLLPKDSWVRSLLFALVAVCSPWIMGEVANISSELFLMTGTLLFLYAIFSGNYVLNVLAVFVVCNATEKGVVTAAMLVFVQLVYAALDRKKTKRPVDILAFMYYVGALALGLLWLWWYKVGNWEDGMKTKTTLGHFLDGQKMMSFGFSPYHLKAVLIASLITNFNWLFTALVIVSAAVWFAKRKHAGDGAASLDLKKYSFLWVGFLANMAVLAAYPTYHNYRYFTVTSVLLCMFGLCGLRYLMENIHLRPALQHAAAGLLAGLVLVQSYTYIDPLTKTILPTFSTGDAELVILPQYIDSEIENTFVDWAYGNRQIMYFEQALDKAYAAIYEQSAVEDAQVLCSNEYAGRIIDGKVKLGSLFMIWGFGYQYYTPPMWGCWNAEGQYRYLSYEPDIVIDPAYVRADTDLSPYMSEHKNVYYIEMPWGDTVIGPLSEKYPSIEPFTTIHHMGWVLKVYKVQ